MANILGIPEEGENNLRKLAAYLLSGNLKADFDMLNFANYSELSDTSYVHNCGTAGCVIGHGPYAGIPKQHETWVDYSERISYIYAHTPLWDWFFSPRWVNTDNTAEGAARRILWTLENGRPYDAWEQMDGEKPLCYI